MQQVFSSHQDPIRVQLSLVQAVAPRRAEGAMEAKAMTSAVSSASSGAGSAAQIQSQTQRQSVVRFSVCGAADRGRAAAGPGRMPFEELVGVCGEGNEDLRLRIHGHHRMKED